LLTEHVFAAARKRETTLAADAPYRLEPRVEIGSPKKKYDTTDHCAGAT
jgi:hypothetical protein